MKFLPKYANFAIIISSFFWGTFWIPLRHINTAGNNSVWPIIVSFLLLSLLLIRPLISTLNKLISEIDKYFFIGNLFSALGIALYSESFLRGEISQVILLFYLCPVWGTILAKIILGQKFNTQRYISLILGIIGLEIILGFDQGVFIPSNIAEWMALTAGFTWSLGITFFHLSKPTNGIEKTALTGFLLPFFFLILTLIPEGRETQLDNIKIIYNDIYIWILLFSIFWLLPSIFFTFVSVEILDPGRVNILLMLEVVIGITSAALLTNEIIGIRQIIGGIIIVSAGLIDFVKIKNF